MSEKKDHTNILQLEADIVKTLKTIFDPEIPVNIYDLGLIYNLDVQDDNEVKITMTLTAPNCPVADHILMEVQEKVQATEGVKKAEVELVFDPPWDQSMMSEEALFDLGML